VAEGRHRHRRQRDEPGGDGAAERRPQHEVAAASCANLALPRPTVRNRQKKQGGHLKSFLTDRSTFALPSGRCGAVRWRTEKTYELILHF
jgi:hypothetical protein